MNPEQIVGVLDKFEKQFEDMDVRAGYMESAMASSTATSTPVDEVDALMNQVADEHGLSLMDTMKEAPSGIKAAPAAVKEKEGDDLEARLAALRK